MVIANNLTDLQLPNHLLLLAEALEIRVWRAYHKLQVKFGHIYLFNSVFTQWKRQHIHIVLWQFFAFKIAEQDTPVNCPAACSMCPV